ncbi:cysteine desulfurase [bacterium]|nr:cysteine desulfurase [bacterium]
MKEHMIYLDYAAATPIDPEVAKAMHAAEGVFANPSARYSLGRKAREMLEVARSQIAQVLACKSSEIVLTSGGSESDNLAIFGLLKDIGRGEIITIPTEHVAVLSPIAQLGQTGFVQKMATIDETGMVDLSKLETTITDQTVLVAIAYASSEIGTIQPIAQIAELVQQERARRKQANEQTPIFLHCDASAAAGRLSLDTNRLGIDTMSLNAAKIYGPKGVGLLYVRRGLNLSPIMLGGGQEAGRRAGTENVPGAAAMAKSLQIAEQMRKAEVSRLTAMTQQLARRLTEELPNVLINGHAKMRLAGHLSFSLDGYNGEDLVAYLDTEGIMVGTGAACEAANRKPSRAVMALGRSQTQAQGTLRLSMGRATTEADLTKFLEVLTSICKTLDTIKV